MNKENRIGIFDSGIGGSTVLREIIKILPNEKYIYYSDSKNNPYGDKPQNEILQICDDIVNYLLQRECKIIVIACNTASARAVDYLRKKYTNIQFVAIEPAYKMVYDYAYDKPTLVMATKGTIESERFNLLYNKYNNNKTILLPCVGLADIIEEGNKEKIWKYLEENIAQYKDQIDNVVLGCTHYDIIKDDIKKVLGNVRFFYGASNLAKHLKNILEEQNMINDDSGEIEFIDSENSKEKEERFFNIINGQNYFHR